MKKQEMCYFTDMHIHILPGLDDGARDFEHSKRMLQIAHDEGTRRIIATPHFMPDARNATREEIVKQVQILQEYADSQNFGIQIYVGNEVYYYDEVPTLLNRGGILPLASSGYVLVEFSPFDDYRYIRNALSEIQMVGFTPILAHVERYTALMQTSYEHVSELKEMGVLIQTNASSVVGKNGRKTKKNVKNLLKNRLIDFVSTDAHGAQHRAPLVNCCAKELYKRCGHEYAEELLHSNAERYIFSQC